MRCIQLLSDNRKATHAFINPHVVHSFKTSNRNYCNQSLSWRKWTRSSVMLRIPGLTVAAHDDLKRFSTSAKHDVLLERTLDTPSPWLRLVHVQEGKDKTEMYVTFLWRRRPRTIMLNFWFRSSVRFSFKNRENMEEVEKKRKQLGEGRGMTTYSSDIFEER